MRTRFINFNEIVTWRLLHQSVEVDRLGRVESVRNRVVDFIFSLLACLGRVHELVIIVKDMHRCPKGSSDGGLLLLTGLRPTSVVRRIGLFGPKIGQLIRYHPVH